MEPWRSITGYDQFLNDYKPDWVPENLTVFSTEITHSATPPTPRPYTNSEGEN